MSFAEAEETVDLNSVSVYEEPIKNVKCLLENKNSYYKDNILFYLSGFIVRKISSKLKCEECIRLLIADDSNLSPYTHFVDYISKGNLVRASSDVIRIVKFMYSLFKNKQNIDKNNLDTKR